MAIVSSLAMGKAEVAKLDFTQDEVDRVKAKLLALTEATITVRSPKRDDQGRIAYIEVPNVGIQLAACVKVMEFAIGKPKQMVVVDGPAATGQGQITPRDLALMVGKNPDIALGIIEMMKRAQAIDVPSTSIINAPPPPES